MFNSSRWSLKRLEGYWKLLIHCKYLHAIQVSGRWIKLWKKKTGSTFQTVRGNKSNYMLPFKKIKHILYQLNSKKNGPILLFKIIMKDWNWFLLSVATDSRDSHEWGNFFMFWCYCTPAKITKRLSQSVLPDKICLIYDAKVAFWHFMWSQNNDTY